MKKFIEKYRGWFIVCMSAFLLVLPDLAEARSRGGGGRRSGGGSFGSTRRSSPSYRTTPRQSPTTRSSPTTTQPRRSFGGTRLSSPQQYTSRYGTPRRSTPVTGVNAQGMPQNYVMHSYGGYGDRFMSGYLMGSIPWMWSMPFHPAFYYSRPYTAPNPDGTISAYPPTFSWGKLFLVILIVGGIAFLIYRFIRARKKASDNYSQGSQGSFV